MKPARALPHLVLASASPRRQELLHGLGLRFEVRPVSADESPLPGETPRQQVVRLARVKAEAEARSGELVLAADTIVEVDGLPLGKPATDERAREMLRALAGRWHRVATGIALCDPAIPRTASLCEISEVRLAALQDEEIDWYVASGEPMDRAGAYGIQERCGAWVRRIEGSYTNVVGLPLFEVIEALRELEAVE